MRYYPVFALLQIAALSVSCHIAYAKSLSILYSFACKPDGAYPEAGLTYRQGQLFGTTYQGGASNFGAIFQIDAETGAEAVVHSFGATSGDGFNPQSGMMYKRGVFYGTTAGGGRHNDGTVFRFNPDTKTEEPVYSFSGGKDGMSPVAGLIETGSLLIGTTNAGGKYGLGTVFSVDAASGKETVLHSFGAGADGENPFAAVLKIGGRLYGTTFSGGGSSYSGTVFKFDIKTRSETVLHSFNSDEAGLLPEAGLTPFGDLLYGTTYAGGGESNGGVLFSINLVTGALIVLHEFGAGEDGASPMATLVTVKDTLYGTTASGGAASGSFGTVFKYETKTGTETVLADFTGGLNGAEPYGSLVYDHGYLYGTTQAGGAGNCGTVFKLKL